MRLMLPVFYTLQPSVLGWVMGHLHRLLMQLIAWQPQASSLRHLLCAHTDTTPPPTPRPRPRPRPGPAPAHAFSLPPAPCLQLPHHHHLVVLHTTHLMTHQSLTAFTAQQVQ
jgi:hypothetical protein